MEACQKHLNLKHELENVDKVPFYTKVDLEAIEKVKIRISNILLEAFDNGLITKQEADTMNPDATSAGKFYMNFKVHKPHVKIPPERPIVSGYGSWANL